MGAALTLSACSTTSSSARLEQAPDKSVAFLKLHNEMVRLASEPSSWGEIRPTASVATLTADLHSGAPLATNP